MSFQTSALILAWVAIALLGLALSGLLRQLHAFRQNLMPPSFDVGPRVGTRAQALEAAVADTQTTVVVFADRGCASCEHVLERVEELAAREWELAFKVAFPGDANGFRSSRVETLVEQAALFEELRIPATPYAVATGPEGAIVAVGPLGSPAMLDDFVQTLREGGTP